MKQTKAPVSQLLGANEEIQRVIVDSCGGATELSHSVACWAKTLPRATTSRLHTKLPGCRADEGPPPLRDPLRQPLWKHHSVKWMCSNRK